MSKKSLFEGAPEPIFGSDEEEQPDVPEVSDENLEAIGQTSSNTATWSRQPRFGQGITDILGSVSGGVTFSQAFFYDGTFTADVLDSTGAIATGWSAGGRVTGYTIDRLNRRRSRTTQHVTVTATPSGNTVGTFRLRLRANTFGAGIPAATIDSDTFSVNNTTTYTWATQPTFDLNENPPHGRVTGSLRLSRYQRANSVPGLVSSAFEIRNHDNTAAVSGWTITISVSSSPHLAHRNFTITADPPDDTDGSFRIRLKQSGIARGAPPIPVDSARFATDNRIVSTWGTLAYCSTSGTTGRVTATITFNKNVTGLAASDIAIPSGWTNPTISGSGRSYTFTVDPAANVSGRFSFTLNANAVTDASDSTVTGPSASDPSDMIDVDNRGNQGRQAIIIDTGIFNKNDEKISWIAYITNATNQQIGSLNAADITLRGAPTGVGIESVTRIASGGSYRITTQQVGLNQTGSAAITIRSNALGTNTNLSTTSGCVFYDTSVPAPAFRPQVIIGNGSFCPTSSVITFPVFVAGATTEQFALLDERDISVQLSAGSFLSLQIINRSSNSFTVSFIAPPSTSGNARITIGANAMGANTNLSVTSSCVGYNTRPTTAPTVATATWGTLATQTGVNAVLQGRLTFATEVNVTDIEPGDFDVIVSTPQGNVVHPPAGWTMQVSHDYTNASRAYVDVSATPNATFVASFGLRLKATSVQSGGSISLNAPAANVDSTVIPFDNSAPSIAPPPSISIDSGTYCPTSKRIVWNAYVTNADSTELDAFGSPDVMVNNAVANGTAFTPTFTVTRTPSTGDSFRIQSSPIPDQTSGEMAITIVANALGSSTNRAVTSGCVSYDTRTVTTPLTATWNYASYCSTSNKVIAGLRFNKAVTGLDVRSPSTDIQVANEMKTANLTGWTLTYAGHTGTGQNGALAANTDLRIEATPPANTNTNAYLLLNMNAVTAGTETGPSSMVYSEVIPVDNRPPDTVTAPLVATWQYANWCSTSNRVYAALRFNKAVTGLDVRSPNVDIQVANARQNANLTGWTLSFSGHTGTGQNASLAANTNLVIEATPPANTNRDVYLHINADSVTAGTQTGPDAITYSETIPVDNRVTPTPVVPLEATWVYANYCSTSNKIMAAVRFNKAITGLNVNTASAMNGDIHVANETKNANLTGWTFAFTGNTGSGTTAALAANTNLVIEATPPANTNANVYMQVVMNSVMSGTQSGPASNVFSEVIPVDNRTPEVVPEPLVGTWNYANYCVTGNKILASISFNKAITGLNVTSATNTDIQVANETKNANVIGWTWTFTGHTGSGTTASLAANTPLVIEVTPAANTNRNVYLQFVRNSVTFDTSRTGPAADIFSEVIPVDNRTEDPADVTAVESPYLEIATAPSGVQTGGTIVITVDAKVAGQLTNVDGFRLDDLEITGPHSPYTYTLEAI